MPCYIPIIHPSIILANYPIYGGGGAGTYPIGHRVRGRVHIWQAACLFEGCVPTETLSFL